MVLGGQAGHGIIRDRLRDMRRDIGTIGPEPVRGPIERAEKCPRADLWIRGPKRTRADPLLDERPDAPLVSIPFRNNPGTQPSRQGVNVEMGRRPFDLVEQTADVGFGQGTDSSGERAVGAVRRRQRGQQALQRPVLTEVEQLVFAAEVVIQVAGRQIRSDGNLAHAGCREAPLPKQPGCGSKDLDPPRIGAA
jgi:hypothetical protein